MLSCPVGFTFGQLKPKKKTPPNVREVEKDRSGRQNLPLKLY